MPPRRKAIKKQKNNEKKNEAVAAALNMPLDSDESDDDNDDDDEEYKPTGEELRAAKRSHFFTTASIFDEPVTTASQISENSANASQETDPMPGPLAYVKALKAKREQQVNMESLLTLSQEDEMN